MNRDELLFLESMDTKRIMSRIITEIDMVGLPNSLHTAYAIAYVITKASEVDNANIDSFENFILSCKIDKEISYFLRIMLESNWNLVSKMSNLFETNLFKACLLFYDSEESRSGYDSTPRQLSKLVFNILNIKESDSFAEYCTGRASFIRDLIMRHTCASCYGNEISIDDANVALMRADILAANITIEEKDVFTLDMSNHSYDKIFSNYPFGLRVRDSISSNNNALRFLNSHLPSIRRSVSSDWLFNTVIVNTLNENGKAVSIMTGGSLWNSLDNEIRQFFVENGYIESIIALPGRVFESTSIMTYLIVFSFNNTNIRFVDVRNIHIKGRRLNELSDENITEIIRLYNNDDTLSKSISNNEIAKEDYNLDPATYFEEKIEIKNSVPFGTIIENITRGAQIRANELDSLASNVPTKYRYLALSDIQNGMIDLPETYISKIPDNMKKYCLKDRDIIIAKIGTPIKVAMADVADDSEILANGNLYIVKIDESKANPYFVKAFLDSDLGHKVLNGATKGSTMPIISLDALKKLPIPCPDIKTQNEVAAEYINAVKELSLAKLSVKKIEDKIKHIYSDSNI